MIDPTLADKLGKLLRMLRSNHDGEVLAAASRINALAVAHDLDWDRMLTAATTDLTREQMTEIYQAGYQRGLEEGAQASRGSDWGNAGVPRTDEVGGRIDEVRTILNAAGRAAVDNKLSQFEIDFSISMLERLDDWSDQTFISERQWGVLNRMRNKLTREGYMS